MEPIGGDNLVDKFIISVEIEAARRRSVEQYPMLIKRGSFPSVKDHLELIKQHFGLIVTLTDFRNNIWTFRPELGLGQQTDILYIRILRTMKDPTYIHIAR